MYLCYRLRKIYYSKQLDQIYIKNVLQTGNVGMW